VRELLDYDENSGIFRWRKSKGRAKGGSVAGTVRPDGYLKLNIDGKPYFLHRLAWFYVHGVWPAETIDHIDLNKANNAISNLREATYHENACNKESNGSASGYKGVGWHICSKKWQVRIKAYGKTKFVGLFDTPEQAYLAYCEAANDLHGEFARVS
jgi:hypothetical protein